MNLEAQLTQAQRRHNAAHTALARAQKTQAKAEQRLERDRRPTPSKGELEVARAVSAVSEAEREAQQAQAAQSRLEAIESWCAAVRLSFELGGALADIATRAREFLALRDQAARGDIDLPGISFWIPRAYDRGAYVALGREMEGLDFRSREHPRVRTVAGFVALGLDVPQAELDSMDKDRGEDLQPRLDSIRRALSGVGNAEGSTQ